VSVYLRTQGLETSKFVTKKPGTRCLGNDYLVVVRLFIQVKTVTDENNAKSTESGETIVRSSNYNMIPI